MLCFVSNCDQQKAHSDLSPDTRNYTNYLYVCWDWEEILFEPHSRRLCSTNRLVISTVFGAGSLFQCKQE